MSSALYPSPIILNPMVSDSWSPPGIVTVLPLASIQDTAESENSTTGASRNYPYYLKDGYIFLVGDQLFKVPRCMLELNSPVFSGMFSIPGGAQVEGLTDSNPIHLEQVESVDFQGLLELLYPLTTKYETFMASWNHNRWISILRLATRWDMTEIRVRAIRRLSELDEFPSPIAKIQCGREYDYPPWIRAGFLALISRDDPSVSEAEGLALGLKDALRCASAREMLLKRTRTHVQYHYGNQVSGSADSILNDVFGTDVPRQGEGVLS